MKQRVVDFFAGTLLVVAYLLLAGLVGNNDPGIEEATTEAPATVTVELVCAESADDTSQPSSRPFLVSHHEPRGPLVPRCVAR
jgi:hypothetical protein